MKIGQSEIELTVKDFSDYRDIETKIYGNFLWNGEDFRYIIVYKDCGVRMFFVKHKNINYLYYCVNKNGNAIIPKSPEDCENHKKEYSIEVIKNPSIEFFIDNLGEDDKITTHYNHFAIKNYNDKTLKAILSCYLTRDTEYLLKNKKMY